MRVRTLPAFVTVSIVTMALAGCASAPEPKSGTIGVAMEAAKFVPAEVTIKAGSTVLWENKDSYAHDVTGQGKAWNSTGGNGGMPEAATFSKRFDQPGTYPYYCTLHSSGPGKGMAGVVIVK